MSKVIAMHRTGSNYICDPPVTDTDKDVIMLVRDVDEASKELVEDGWKLGISDVYDGLELVFLSFKKETSGDGLYNALITSNVGYYKCFVQATEYAKKLNLTNKAERVAFFNMFLSQYLLAWAVDGKHCDAVVDHCEAAKAYYINKAMV